MNDFVFKQDAPGYRATVDSSWVSAAASGCSLGLPGYKQSNT